MWRLLIGLRKRCCWPSKTFLQAVFDSGLAVFQLLNSKSPVLLMDAFEKFCDLRKVTELIHGKPRNKQKILWLSLVFSHTMWETEWWAQKRFVWGVFLGRGDLSFEWRIHFGGLEIEGLVFEGTSDRDVHRLKFPTRKSWKCHALAVWWENDYCSVMYLNKQWATEDRAGLCQGQILSLNILLNFSEAQFPHLKKMRIIFTFEGGCANWENQ